MAEMLWATSQPCKAELVQKLYDEVVESGSTSEVTVPSLSLTGTPCMLPVCSCTVLDWEASRKLPLATLSALEAKRGHLHDCSTHRVAAPAHIQGPDLSTSPSA